MPENLKASRNPILPHRWICFSFITPVQPFVIETAKPVGWLAEPIWQHRSR